jgi:hypothetical protein
MSDLEPIGEFVATIASRATGKPVPLPEGLPRRPEPPAEFVKRTQREDSRFATLAAIPEEFRGARLASDELAKLCFDRTAIERVRKAAPTLLAFFAGASRAGKTTLATALYVHRVTASSWPSGQWVRAQRLMIEATREVPRGSVPRGLEMARNTGVLLLDDLGKEAATDEARALIEDLVMERHDAHRPTIVTTGLTKDELQRRYGAGMVERLTDGSRALVVEVKKRAR